VFLVVDVQNCFVPGGTLPVEDGDKVVPVINRLAPAFEHVIPACRAGVRAKPIPMGV
jgi:nicotinamidase-related amidase